MTKTRKPGSGGSRPGAGRPPTLHEPTIVQVRLEAGQIEALDRLARQYQTTRSDLIRRAIALLISNNADDY